MADTTIIINEAPWRDTDVLIFPAQAVDGDRAHGNPPSSHDPVQTIAVAEDGTLTVTVAGADEAHVVTGVVADDNAIEWTAQDPGSAGNDITIALTDPEDVDQSLSVVVTDLAIEVLLETDSGGDIASTADDVKTAIAGDVDADALVAVADEGASDGSGLVEAFSATNLAYGEDDLATGRYYAYGPVTIPVTTGFPDDDESGTTTRHEYIGFKVQ